MKKGAVHIATDPNVQRVASDLMHDLEAQMKAKKRAMRVVRLVRWIFKKDKSDKGHR